VKSPSINIREVARAAGVGVATVSRVINGSKLISPAMREHVEAVIRRLNFRPHALARRILGHSQLIGFVLANRPFLHSFHAGILQGAENCARSLKRHVVFLGAECPPGAPPGEIVLPPVLEEKGWVEGVVLTGVVYPNLIARLKELELPLVVFGNNAFEGDWAEGVGQVRYDGAQAECAAAEYLIERGHRAIAYVGDAAFPWFREQRRGFLRALRRHGLHPLSFTQSGPDDHVEYGRWAGETMLKAGPAPTAFLAGNDEIAFGLYRALRGLHRHVPGDASVIGFDDRQIAAVMDPPLTTVRVPSQEIGCRCVRLLLERLEGSGESSDTQWVSAELVERGSVKPPRGRAG
jgi:LacI family transcriptional regulator